MATSGDGRNAVLYDYWRSSAAYRVRIALHLLEIPFRTAPIDLLSNSHQSDRYKSLNPQGLVPSLEIDGQFLTQSLAIIEFLNDTTAGSELVPDDPIQRHRVRQLSFVIAMEIHPICNLRVASHASQSARDKEAARLAWMQHYIGRGLADLEMLLEQSAPSRFCLGDTPSMADCCLIPQLYNARRWNLPVDDLTRVLAIENACQSIDAFAKSHPDVVGPPKEP